MSEIELNILLKEKENLLEILKNDIKNIKLEIIKCNIDKLNLSEYTEIDINFFNYHWKCMFKCFDKIYQHNITGLYYSYFNNKLKEIDIINNFQYIFNDLKYSHIYEDKYKNKIYAYKYISIYFIYFNKEWIELN